MTELLTAAQMRAIEQAAILSGEVSGLALMERAGQGVVDVILQEWPQYETAPQSVTILCGPGNNGGDGFVVARLLLQLGWQVRVLLYGDANKLPADARYNYNLWLGIGPVEALTETAFRASPPAAVYVDAIFGTGLTRPPEGEIAGVLRHLAGSGGDDYALSLVAVDAPSGLCLDSGRILGGGVAGFSAPAPVARVTVTFDSPKIGHFLADGPACCGRLAIVDIGLQKWRETDVSKHCIRCPVTSLVTRRPLVRDERNSFTDISAAAYKTAGHKFDSGHALILSGPATKTGAARLAARGALRIGAGLVTIGSPRRALSEHAAQLNAIMLTEISAADALESVLQDQRITSLCLGPGMGLADTTREMVKVALTSSRKTVLDADALSVFKGNPRELFEMLHENVVLTPHAGEFSRLFPDIFARLNEKSTNGPAYSKVDATRAAAQQAGAVVLFKGADTVIAAPDGRVAVHSAHYQRSAPWLATAGAGDVLAGMIAGMMARGYPAARAAEIAVWLHVECAVGFGAGLIAEDLPERLPATLGALRA